MRGLIIAWGRQRWPRACVIHELQIAGTRIDLAFVTHDAQLIGVEIKSDHDSMARLPKQMAAYTRMIPEVWIATGKTHYKYVDEKKPWKVGHLLVHEGKVSMPENIYARAKPNPRITVDMLHILHKQELIYTGRAHNLDQIKTKLTVTQLIDILAQQLRGCEIVEAVCQCLRARPIVGYSADPPCGPFPGFGYWKGMP